MAKCLMGYSKHRMILRRREHRLILSSGSGKDKGVSSFQSYIILANHADWCSVFSLSYSCKSCRWQCAHFLFMCPYICKKTTPKRNKCWWQSVSWEIVSTGWLYMVGSIDWFVPLAQEKIRELWFLQDIFFMEYKCNFGITQMGKLRCIWDISNNPNLWK